MGFAILGLCARQ